MRHEARPVAQFAGDTLPRAARHCALISAPITTITTTTKTSRRAAEVM